MKNFDLSKKAQKLLEDLFSDLRQKQADYTYLYMCCVNYQYRNAADYFHEKSKSLFYEMDNLISYCLGRDFEMEVPKTDQPEIDFKDLKGSVEYANDMEIESAKSLEKSAHDMFDEDLLTYQFFMNTLSSQQYVLKDYKEKWTILKDMDEMQEGDKMAFGKIEPKEIPA